MSTPLETVSLDDSTENADWSKQTWDLPPYRSAEFMRMYPDLDAFRRLPIYQHAVAAGLIHDDEWVADHTAPHEEQDAQGEAQDPQDPTLEGLEDE